MSPVTAPRATTGRVIVLLTLAFWLMVAGVVITSPNLLFIGVGVPAVFVFYATVLVGYLWFIESRAGRLASAASPRPRRRTGGHRHRTGLSGARAT